MDTRPGKSRNPCWRYEYFLCYGGNKLCCAVESKGRHVLRYMGGYSTEGAYLVLLYSVWQPFRSHVLGFAQFGTPCKSQARYVWGSGPACFVAPLIYAANAIYVTRYAG